MFISQLNFKRNEQRRILKSLIVKRVRTLKIKTMEKTLVQERPIFSMNFDFRSREQQEILNSLQKERYKLVGYMGASGTNQVISGVPTWFVIDYTSVFGVLKINYEQIYKVYVYRRSDITVNTKIIMEVLSDVVTLGSEATFNPDGTFPTTLGAPGVITVKNNRPGDSSPITVGLAAYMNGIFLPFCAFTCAAQETVSIIPDEKIALFASQTNATPGSMAGQAHEFGCTFRFSDQNMNYDLQMVQTTFGIKNIPGTFPVEQVAPAASLAPILNTL
jgi:hypothetical protein